MARLASTIFYLFIRDLFIAFNDCPKMCLGLILLYCLLHVDELELFAASEQKLQQLLDTSLFAAANKLTINLNKSKVNGL